MNVRLVRVGLWMNPIAISRPSLSLYVARASIESHAGSLVVHTGCIRRNRASQIDFQFCCDRLKLLKPLARYIESTLFIFVLTRLYVAGHKAGDLSFNI